MEFFTSTLLWELLPVFFLLGMAAFMLSTLSGGGGALMMLPVLNVLIGTGQTAPIVNLGTFIGRPSRLWLFRKHINWQISAWYIPSAIVGSIISAFFFAQMDWSFLQLFVGLFLISTIFQFRFGKKERSFKVKKHHFLYLGFFVSFIGTLIGALGPVLNPFYLNAGLKKEDLIGTKTANSFFVGIAQIGSYSFFGLLTADLWVYGLCLGLGASLGNVLGKRYLKRLSNLWFRRLLLLFMLLSGLLLVLRQLMRFWL